MNIHRRRFCKAITVGLAGMTLPTSLSLPGKAATKPSVVGPIIDTHTHFYDPTRPQGVPWPGKDDKVLYRRVLPADYKALTASHGVAGTVVVEASPWVEDNQWILDLAAMDPFIVGLVGNLNPNTSDYLTQLKRFAQNPLLRGIRFGSDLIRKSLDQPALMTAMKQLADLDLALDVLIGPDMLKTTARLGAAIPELRIMIDHVANLRIDGQAVPDLWREGMQAVGKLSNVYCKVSGLVEGSGRTDGKAPNDVAFYQPVLDAIWQYFGEDRLVYGSNWPVSERFAPYSTVQQIVVDYFQAKGQTAVEKVFWRNSKTIYKWVKR